MKRKFSLSIILILLSFATKAQYFTPDKQGATSKSRTGIFQDWKERIYFGGNIGLGFAPGAKYFYIQASPLIGYRITERFSVGNTFTYIYLQQRLGYITSQTSIYTFDYSSHIFGISPFSRMFLTDWLFLHAEYNIFSADLIKTNNSGPDYVYAERGFISYPLIGGGFLYSIGQRGGIMIMALFNPVYSNIKDKFPLYNSPLVLRVGFVFR